MLVRSVIYIHRRDGMSREFRIAACLVSCSLSCDSQRATYVPGHPPAAVTYAYKEPNAVSEIYFPPGSTGITGQSGFTYEMECVFPPSELVDAIRKHLVCHGWYIAEGRLDEVTTNLEWTPLEPSAKHTGNKQLNCWWIHPNGEMLLLRLLFFSDRPASNGKFWFNVLFKHYSPELAQGYLAEYARTHTTPWSRAESKPSEGRE
jgi:hypothetical protein